MSTRPTIVDARVTTGGAPVQIEGRLSDGSFFYFRARHRSVSLGIGTTEDEAVMGVHGQLGFVLDGLPEEHHVLSWISTEEAHALLNILVRLWGDHRKDLR